jgi:hypothetical protein
VTADVLRAALANAEKIAERARIAADQAAMPRKSGKVPGAGYKRGGVDHAHAADMRRKADDADRAVRDLRQMIDPEPTTALVYVTTDAPLDRDVETLHAAGCAHLRRIDSRVQLPVESTTVDGAVAELADRGLSEAVRVLPCARKVSAR